MNNLFLTSGTTLLQWFNDNILRLVFSIVTILSVIVLILIMKIISSKVKRSQNKRGYTVIKLIESIVKYLVIIVAIFVLLGIWGVKVGAALIGFGVVILVIGLSALEVIKDLISGIAIIIENLYDVDEIIEINGFKGKVLEIGIRTTKITNQLGEIKIIRNGMISQLSNFSRTYSVAIVLIEVPNTENINQVTKLLEEKLSLLNENYPQIIEGPLVVGIEKLTPTGVVIKITAKTNPETHYSVRRAMLKQIKETLETPVLKPVDQKSKDPVINTRTEKNERSKKQYA